MAAKSTTADLDSQPMWFDHAASTPVRPEVLHAMAPWWASPYHPSSPGRPGWEASEARALAVSQILERFGRTDLDVLFTSGATEANNQVVAQGNVLTVATAHLSMLAPVRAANGRVAPVVGEGRYCVEMLARNRAPDTQIVSVLAVNNETGVQNDLGPLWTWCKDNGLLLHVDASQAACLEGPVLGDLITVSSHKIGGPRGVGALLFDQTPAPLLRGGDQQAGRSGTLPMALAVGLGAAASRPVDQLAMRSLQDQLWRGLERLGGQRNIQRDTAPQIASVWWPEHDAEALRSLLASEAIVSTGSACSAGRPSTVLDALGLSGRQGRVTRVSMGWSTRASEVDGLLELLGRTLA